MYNDTAQDQEESIWHPTTPSTINQSKVTVTCLTGEVAEVGDTGGSRSVQAEQAKTSRAHTRGTKGETTAKPSSKLRNLT